MIPFQQGGLGRFSIRARISRAEKTDSGLRLTCTDALDMRTIIERTQNLHILAQKNDQSFP